MRDYRDAKAMAKAMREALAGAGLMVTHAQALEVVARQFGLANWNVLSARIDDASGETKAQDVAASGSIVLQQAVPIVRIFDVAKAREFYLDFLGFTIDWDHRYGEDFPVYMQVSRSGLMLHLSEHSGDATPGGNMCVYMTGIRDLHAELTGKQYRYMRPGLEKTGDRLEVQVTDPFNNRIRFMEVVG